MKVYNIIFAILSFVFAVQAADDTEDDTTIYITAIATVVQTVNGDNGAVTLPVSDEEETTTHTIMSTLTTTTANATTTVPTVSPVNGANGVVVNSLLGLMAAGLLLLL